MSGATSGPGIGAIYDNQPNQSMLLNNSIIQSKLVPKNAPGAAGPQDIRTSLGLES
jgi:hypothetical protein